MTLPQSTVFTLLLSRIGSIFSKEVPPASTEQTSVASELHELPVLCHQVHPEVTGMSYMSVWHWAY